MIEVSLKESNPPPGAFLKKTLAKADDIRPLMTKFGRYMVPGAITRHWPESPVVTRYGAPGVPLMDSGRLRDSIQATPTARDLLLRTNVPYARIHQYGGLITPVTAKWLAIPVYPALSISEIRSHRSPRAYKGLFVLMHGPEGPGLYRKKGRKGIQIVFRFVKSVLIPARPFMFYSKEDMAVLQRMTREYFGGQ